MDRFRKPAEVAEDLPPSEAWLFAQLILGKPIPRIVSPEKTARAKREKLERLAQFPSRHAEELRHLQLAEAEARQERELLEWAAQISTRAQEKLRLLQQKETTEREAWRRVEQFCETYYASMTEWDEADHPRQPKGSPHGGEWVAKDAAAGGATGTQDPKANYVRDFDTSHDLTLRGAIKNGKVSAGDIPRIKFTDDEIKEILRSTEKPGSDLNLTFYTAQNLPDVLRAEAEKDFANLPGDDKYAMQAFVSNQRRARTILLVRNVAFQEYVGQLYGLLRSLNPTHFTLEKGTVVLTGKEPVLGGNASRLGALTEMLIYLVVIKGVGWGASKISRLIVGPEATGEITIAFEGGGKLTIRRGAKYDPETLKDAVERGAAGEKVTIDPPAPKAPRPSLTDVPRIKDDPRAFRRWFNELTPDELTTVWRNPKLRKAVEEGLRWPRYYHEWLMIGRTPKFKEWGITAEQIAEMRTPTSKVRFKNPTGGHEGKGATTTHNQILKIIDSSPDFATFKSRLQKWASERLEGGADALPPGLRP